MDSEINSEGLVSDEEKPTESKAKEKHSKKKKEKKEIEMSLCLRVTHLIFAIIMILFIIADELLISITRKKCIYSNVVDEVGILICAIFFVLIFCKYKVKRTFMIAYIISINFGFLGLRLLGIFEIYDDSTDYKLLYPYILIGSRTLLLIFALIAAYYNKFK